MAKIATNNILPFTAKREKQLTILAVEDDRLERAFLEEQVQELGHNLMQAVNGQEALVLLQKNYDQIDVVLMDRMMPVMDGMTAVRHMKEHPRLRRIPVVMITGATSHEEMKEGLEAGVFYYLTKPVDEDVLRSVLIAATREAQQNRTLNEELKRHKTSFNLIDTCKFEYKTLEEAECLAAFLAQCFPDPDRVINGLAELLINAVEHGNLEVGYDLKSELLNAGAWREVIEERQKSAAFIDKKVEVVFTRKSDGLYVVITDQGRGFNWKKFMTIDPARAGDNHGRGIAQANTMSFDRLTYNEEGNQAVAYVGHSKDIEW